MQHAPEYQVTRGILAHYNPDHVRGGEPALVRLYNDCKEEQKDHRLEVARTAPTSAAHKHSWVCLRALRTAENVLRHAIAAEAASALAADDAYDAAMPDIGRLRISRLGAKRRHPYEGGANKRQRR